jgi:periplasmic copper chaperone A
MRSRPLALALLALGLAAAPASSHEETKGGVTVAHPWVRATPGGVTNGAAYLEIKAAGGVTDKLIGASSVVAGRAELHTHIMDGAVMKMRRVETIEVKGGQSVVLKPSGDHLMLMDLKAPLKEGDLIKLTLTFEKAGPIEVEATVEPIGANGPHGMDHQPGHEGHASPASGAAGGHKH